VVVTLFSGAGFVKFSASLFSLTRVLSAFSFLSVLLFESCAARVEPFSVLSFIFSLTTIVNFLPGF